MEEAYYIKYKALREKGKEKKYSQFAGGGGGVPKREKLLADTSRDGRATENNHVFHIDLIINFSDKKAVSMHVWNLLCHFLIMMCDFERFNQAVLHVWGRHKLS